MHFVSCQMWRTAFDSVEKNTVQGKSRVKSVISKSHVCVFVLFFVLMQEVTATSRHYVDRLFDPDPQKVLQGVM